MEAGNDFSGIGYMEFLDSNVARLAAVKDTQMC